MEVHLEGKESEVERDRRMEISSGLDIATPFLPLSSLSPSPSLHLSVSGANSSPGSCSLSSPRALRQAQIDRSRIRQTDPLHKLTHNFHLTKNTGARTFTHMYTGPCSLNLLF